MHSADEYISRTESAVRGFFESVDSYVSRLKRASIPVLVSDTEPSTAELEAWLQENAAALETVRRAQRDYFDESFALATVCGSVLQVAAKAFERYSRNATVPPDWQEVVNPGYARYCVGRRVRGVPLGLVVLAGRNQHMHFQDDHPLREPNVGVFKRLASFDGRYGESVVDPAFDLSNGMLVSFAHNITGLLGWRSYDAYKRDVTETLSPGVEQ